VGLGYDAHRLVPDRPLILGGVTIPSDLGILGHSDGDVLCHAIADALLGAVALGDLGGYFPSDDSEIEGISSLKILEEIWDKITHKQYRLGNIDSTIILQSPQIGTWIPEMRRNLATVFSAETDQISIKATTTDHLGFPGRHEGIAAQAAALLV